MWCRAGHLPNLKLYKMDSVFIKDLKVSCIIGILPHERQVEQELVINVRVHLDLSQCAKSGDLSLSVDYAALASKLAAFAKQAKEELLEVLAQRMCAMIFENFAAESVTLSLAKTQAVADCHMAGIEITRYRN